MKQYQDLMKTILENGKDKTDRTGVGTKSIFGAQMRFDLSEGFPAVTTKKLFWKGFVAELLWMIEGSTDERRLCEIMHGTRDDSKTTFWTANANAPYWIDKANFKGDLGKVYGYQWRHWETNKVRWISSNESEPVIIDQLAELIDGIKNNPSSRRHIMSAWNVAQLEDMALPPCHVLSQFDVTDGKLSCQLYQRSADFFLGVPANILSYSLLTQLIAQVCDLEVGEFIWTGGDVHIYNDHIEQAKEQLSRNPYQLPTLWLNQDIKNIDDFTMDDIKLLDYHHHPSIKADMAV